MSVHPSVPMRPEDLPQQKVYLVKNLPPKPPGFDCQCALENDVPEGIAPASLPRSAGFVGMVEWAWSPMHDRIDSYFLSTNRRRSHWILWRKPSYDEGSEAFVYAFGPKLGVPAEVAAVHLLLCAWCFEAENYVDRYHWIDGTGLLSVGDLEAIADLVWDEAGSLDALRESEEDHACEEEKAEEGRPPESVTP